MIDIKYKFKDEQDQSTKQRMLEYMRKNKRRTQTLARNMQDVFFANPNLTGIEINIKTGDV